MSRSKTSLQLALVLSPKSIPTELSVLGNTSGKTSTTKLRIYQSYFMCVQNLTIF